MQTVSTYIMRTLKLSGVDVVFGYPGQSNLHLLHAAREAGIRYVQTADERSAGFAAAGYALSTNRPVAVCVSKGPAASNLLTSLMSAGKDGVPVVALTGNVGDQYAGLNAFQAFDPVRVFMEAGAVKSARFVNDPARIPGALAELFRTAWTEPQGPTLLDIPYDICACGLGAEPAAIRIPPAEDVAGVDSSVLEAARSLEQAVRPVLLVGRGARLHYEQVRQFAALYDLPVVHTIGGTGVMSSDDPRYGGLLRHNGSTQAAHLVQNADLVIALGTGLDERATGSRSRFAPYASKVHVDLDANVLARQEDGIRVRAAVSRFLLDVARLAPSAGDHRDWILEARAHAASGTRRRKGLEPLTAGEIVDAASEVLAESIVVKDSGSHKYWITRLAPCRAPRMSVASCHFGSMGFGLPAAVGASIGSPRQRVVAMCGDGCFLMSFQDLLTVAGEECHNLKIVIFNNGGLGSTRDFEARVCPEAQPISDFGGHVSCVDLASSLGIESHVVAQRGQLPGMVEALKSPGLMVFDCRLDRVEVMSPAASYRDSLDSLLTLTHPPAAGAREELVPVQGSLPAAGCGRPAR